MHVYSAYDTLVNPNGSIAHTCGHLLCRSSEDLVHFKFFNVWPQYVVNRRSFYGSVFYFKLCVFNFLSSGKCSPKVSFPKKNVLAFYFLYES